MLQKHQQWKKTQEALRALRPLISEPARAQYFDESLDANELEIALHALCDFMLRDGAPPIDGAALAQIDSLHHLMGINDSCVNKLRLNATRAKGHDV